MTMAVGEGLREIQVIASYYNIPGKAVRRDGHNSRLGIRISGFYGGPKVTWEESVFSVPCKCYQPLARPPK